MNHVVALSGGKDSTAMALRLAESEPRPYLYVCTPTGDEPPEMFEHWRKLGKLLGQPVLPVMADTLGGLIRKQNALPNWRQRWCTRILKIEPYARFLVSLGACTSYVGLRADESEREGASYAGSPNVEVDYPLRRWGWGLAEVLAYLKERDVQIPKRTDCLKCFFQRLGEWYAFWKEHPDSWAEGEALEELTGHTFRSPGRDTWPASMKDLRKEFEAGRVPKGVVGAQNNRCLVCRL